MGEFGMIKQQPFRRWQGGYDLGQTLSRYIQVPWGLTDRETGIVYYLTASSGPPARLALNTTPPGDGPVVPSTIYAPGDEPVFATGLPGAPNLRVFVRGGRLGFEDKNTHIFGGPRHLAQHVTNWRSVKYELVVPAGFSHPSGRLAFQTEVDF